MLAATASIVKTDGPGALLSGLGPTVVGYGIEGAMKFGVYEMAKPVFGALLKDNTTLAFILASIVAGAIAALLLCPMESLRIRQVTDVRYAKDSLLTGLPKLIQEQGVASLFGGVLAMLAKQVSPPIVNQSLLSLCFSIHSSGGTVLVVSNTLPLLSLLSL
jgi:solute carrier family 25 phosphate transporter 3